VFVLRILRAGALVVVVLLCLGDGVAAADPLPVADVTQSADTDDGWHLSAALTRMTINSVPNMAATAFTREVSSRERPPHRSTATALPL
jgi:hypothetical protein